ncbi:putative ABC transporter permease subunit [Inconstantimicrobium mannanitabidum]|nr:hypothetical protein [Clostridium sp. TW13]
MRNILLLTKVLFKSGGNMGLGGKNSKKSSKLSNVGGVFLYLLLALCFVPLGFAVFEMLDGMYQSLNAVNQGGYVIGLSFVMVSFIIFFFSIFSIAAVLFYSKDIGYLLPLPFKPREITLAKFLYILIGEYLIEALIVIPTYAVWVVNNGVTPLFIINAILVFLLTPVFPILVASIIIMPIMRFSSLSKHKDAFTVISSLMAIVVGLGINVFMNRTGSMLHGNKMAMAQQILQTKNGMLSSISGLFINARLGAEALTGNTANQVINVLLLLLIVALAVMLFVVLSDALYLKGAMSISDSASKKTKISNEEFDKSTNMNGQISTLVKREMKILMRTPVYLLNCVGTIIIMPICFVPMLFVNKGGINFSSVGASMQNNNVKQSIALLVVYGAITLFAGISPTASTAISREGSIFFVSKYIPVDYMKQIWAKLIPSIAINFLGTLIMAVGVTILLHISVDICLIALLIGLLISSFTAFLGILVDLIRPKLVWNGEEQAVKQNLNSFIGFIISCVLLGICAIPVVMFCLDSMWLTAGAIIGILVVLNLIGYFIVSTYGVSRFKAIE